jgi:hypothetical protein
MHSFKDFYLTEIGDSRAFTWENFGGYYTTDFKIDDDMVTVIISGIFNVEDDKSNLDISFKVNNIWSKGFPKSPVRILGGVMAAVKDFVLPRKDTIKSIHFSSFSSNADSLYEIFARKIAAKLGWHIITQTKGEWKIVAPQIISTVR